MSAFPLLILPPDTIQTLLNYYDTEKLFQLSQCSRRARDNVKTYTSTLFPSFHLFISAHYTKPYVFLFSPHHTSGVLFHFYEERDVGRHNLQLPEAYNFDGLSIDLCREVTDTFPSFGSDTTHSTADVLKFSHYLLTVFNADIDDMSFEVDDSMDSMDPILMSKCLQNSVKCSIEGGVTHEEMVQMLELCDGARSVQWNLSCSPGQHFLYDKTISGYNIYMNHATWIKRHNLLKLDCDYVYISGCLLENEDLNAFLSHWLQSGDKKLKFMKIRGKYYFSEEERKNAYKFVEEEVLKGLPTLPGAPKRQDAIIALNSRHTDVPFEAGMDLRRESDGVLATVVVREEDYWVTFTFVVWQEPNPNVDI